MDSNDVRGRAGHFARWARFGNNRQRDTVMDRATVQDDETVDSLTDPAAEQPAGVGVAAAEVEDRATDASAAGDESAESLQLRAERDGLRDRLSRLQAEFDNARKRESKER